MRKKLKKILEQQRKEYQKYLNILSEHFESQVKVVAEVLGGIQKQLVALREMVAKNKKYIEMIKIDLNLIKQNLRQKVDRDEFEALERKVFLLEKKVSR